MRLLHIIFAGLCFISTVQVVVLMFGYSMQMVQAPLSFSVVRDRLTRSTRRNRVSKETERKLQETKKQRPVEMAKHAIPPWGMSKPLLEEDSNYTELMDRFFAFFRKARELRNGSAQHIVPSNRLETSLYEEIQELLLTVKLDSILIIGPSFRREILEMCASRFKRVVVLTIDKAMPDVQTKHELSLKYPHVEYVVSDITKFRNESGLQFDVVLLDMLLHTLHIHEVDPTLLSLEALLNDEGLGIISTTYADEGHELARPNTSVKDERVGVSRQYSTSEFMQVLSGRTWEITSHVLFTSKLEQTDSSVDRSRNAPTKSMAQVAAVRRYVVHDSTKFAAPLEPSSPGVKDVIFALVRGGSYRSDFDDFVSSRKCLRSALSTANKASERPNETPIDEVVFHEGNIPVHLQQSLEMELHGLRFVDIRQYAAFGGLGNGNRGGINRWSPWLRLRKPGEYSVGYRHMCRFMAMLWMYVLSKYEYAMRVDSDVCIHTMVHPFIYSREASVDYAYGLLTTEKHAETVRTLSPWLMTYLKKRNMVPITVPDVRTMYFTNVFVTNVSWWLNDFVRIFMHTVDRSGNIYNHRWGDAPLQTAALRIFAAPQRVKWIRIDYSHLSTSNEVRNGTETEFLQSTTSPLKEKPEAMLSAQKYTDDWNSYIAPCLVADFFNLPGSPFKSQAAAIKALKLVLKDRAIAEKIDVERYSAADLAYAVQFDIYNSTQPIPADGVEGAERRNTMYRLLTGKDRAHPENKDFFVFEKTSLSTSPCYRSKLVLDMIPGWRAYQLEKLSRAKSKANIPHMEQRFAGPEKWMSQLSLLKTFQRKDPPKITKLGSAHQR